jgi:hypothetical protein
MQIMIKTVLQNLRRLQLIWLEPLLEGQKSAIPTPTLHSLAYAKAVEDSYLELEEEIKKALIFRKSPKEIRAYCCKRILSTGFKPESGLLLEFGVFKGESINFFSERCEKFHFFGFDSFEGLPYDWAGTHIPAGRCNLNGVRPPVRDNVTLITGRIEKTLPKFLSGNKEKAIFFAHIDTDIYESAKAILPEIKPRLVSGSIILFDELICYPGWRHGGYKALQEVFPRESYEFIAFSKYEAAIRIV